MAYSFTWLYVILLISLILVIIATVISFFTPGYLTATEPASLVANEHTARALLYGAGVIGLFIIILLFWAFYNVYGRPVDLTADLVDVINANYFGAGTLILTLVLIVLVIVMIIMIFYAFSLLEHTTISSISNAKWWIMVAGILLIFVLIMIFVTFYFYYSYNKYLELLVPVVPLTPVTPVAPVTAVAPVVPSTVNLCNIFSLTRSNLGLGLGDFKGVVTVKGTLLEPDMVTSPGVNNNLPRKSTDIDCSYLHDDLSLRTPVVAPVAVTPVAVAPVAAPIAVPVRKVPVAVANVPMTRARVF